MTLWQTSDEITLLVRQFDACTLPHDQWTHQAHLTVALWYLSRFPEDGATRLIRSGIQALNKSQGVVDTPKTGYHETITLFYVRQISAYLRRREPDTPLVALANGLIQEWGDKNLIRQYYSRGLLLSSPARASWMEPDLRPLQEPPAF